MTITKVEYRAHKSGSLLGFADIILDDSFVVKGCTVMTGPHGLYVQFPKKQGKDQEWREICHPITAELRKEIQTKVLAKVPNTPTVDGNETKSTHSDDNFSF